MNRKRRKEEISASLKLLAATYVRTVRQLERQMEETLATLCRELELEDAGWLDSVLAIDVDVAPPSSAFRPVADRSTLSVVFQGKSCFLGNTLLFRFFEALSRRPNRYFAHSELLDEVWGGQRSESSIRNVAKRLRDRLVLTGMAEVANAIDGSTAGYYILRSPVSE
ncbi:helix-turn-helix domain-containing protein [Planctomicrobium sp. SH661]|uniref:helix-turn-helix domain-containing protein n=1 Tax=Planctomicrobium sp. SH661 TaxID=3448124 RepID=UPI003F5BE3D5